MEHQYTAAPSHKSQKFVDDCLAAMAEARRIAEAQTLLAAELLRLGEIAKGPMDLTGRSDT